MEVKVVAVTRMEAIAAQVKTVVPIRAKPGRGAIASR
jgi:hypothetical protein